MRRPDLLILIAVWEFLGAFGAFIGIIAISVFAFPVVSSSHGIGSVGGIFGLSIAVLVLLFCLCISIAGGIGLLGGKGWGRRLSLVLAVIGLRGIPFVTIIELLVMFYFKSPELRKNLDLTKK